jgi:hypothetical protein
MMAPLAGEIDNLCHKGNTWWRGNIDFLGCQCVCECDFEGGEKIAEEYSVEHVFRN